MIGRVSAYWRGGPSLAGSPKDSAFLRWNRRASGDYVRVITGSRSPSRRHLREIVKIRPNDCGREKNVTFWKD
jgi:hypothetical protein